MSSCPEPGLVADLEDSLEEAETEEEEAWKEEVFQGTQTQEAGLDSQKTPTGCRETDDRRPSND